MNLYLTLPLVSFFGWNAHQTTATNWENLDLIERIDQGNNPINCVPIASDPGRCNELRMINSRNLLLPEDCPNPFTYNNMKNICTIDADSNYFRNYLVQKGCLFREKNDGSCEKFDENDTCESRKRRLKKYEFTVCSDGNSNICLYNMKYGAKNFKQIQNVDNFFKTNIDLTLSSGTKLEFYFNKNLIDIDDYEREWRYFLTKFNVCYDFFVSQLNNYNQKYHHQVEKWCLLNTIDDYYYFNNNFKQNINVLRFGAHDAAEIYKEIQNNYTEISKNVMRLYVESNKDKDNIYESPFTFLLYDLNDENLSDPKACAESIGQ